MSDAAADRRIVSTILARVLPSHRTSSSSSLQSKCLETLRRLRVRPGPVPRLGRCDTSEARAAVVVEHVARRTGVARIASRVIAASVAARPKDLVVLSDALRPWISRDDDDENDENDGLRAAAARLAAVVPDARGVATRARRALARWTARETDASAAAADEARRERRPRAAACLYAACLAAAGRDRDDALREAVVRACRLTDREVHRASLRAASATTSADYALDEEGAVAVRGPRRRNARKRTSGVAFADDARNGAKPRDEALINDDDDAAVVRDDISDSAADLVDDDDDDDDVSSKRSTTTSVSKTTKRTTNDDFVEKMVALRDSLSSISSNAATRSPAYVDWRRRALDAASRTSEDDADNVVASGVHA